MLARIRGTTLLEEDCLTRVAPVLELVAVSTALALSVGCSGGGSSRAPSSPTSPTTPGTPTTPTTSVCRVVGGFAVTGIVNGTECAAGNTPVVKLNLYGKDGITGFCSGTIIAPRAVLTAAHCLADGVTSVKIYQGSGDQVTASSFSVHPSYHRSSSGSSGLDVGVVLTGQDLDRTPMPVLVSRDAVVGEQGVIAGWGQDVSGSGGNTLRAGGVTLSSVGASLIETKNGESVSAVCSGDSGGPLIVSEGGLWAVAGVTSATSLGGSCASGTSYYTNVRHEDVRSFILGAVQAAAQK